MTETNRTEYEYEQRFNHKKYVDRNRRLQSVG